MKTEAPGSHGCDRDLAELRGPLSRSKRREHEAHLSSCGDCRMMARLNADLDPLGDLRPGDEAVVAAAARAALSRWRQLEQPAGKRRAMQGLLAIALIVGTSAGALAARQQLIRLASTAGEALFSSRGIFRRNRAALRPAAVPSTRRQDGVAPAITSVATPAAGTTVSLVPATVAVGEGPIDSRRFRRGAITAIGAARDPRTPRSTNVTVPAEIRIPAVPPAPIDVPLPPTGGYESRASVAKVNGDESIDPVPPEASTPGDLLARGAAARTRGERGAALASFRQLQVRFPGTVEAKVALISSGQLLIDRGDLEGALAVFRAYRDRAPAGSLTEEALDGAGRALGGLGHFDEERKVWLELLTRFPRSVYLQRAAQRLRALR